MVADCGGPLGLCTIFCLRQPGPSLVPRCDPGAGLFEAFGLPKRPFRRLRSTASADEPGRVASATPESGGAGHPRRDPLSLTRQPGPGKKVVRLFPPGKPPTSDSPANGVPEMRFSRRQNRTTFHSCQNRRGSPPPRRCDREAGQTQERGAWLGDGLNARNAETKPVDRDRDGMGHGRALSAGAGRRRAGGSLP